MNAWSVIDTSWLLELYRVPGASATSRYDDVARQAGEAAQGTMFVTLPVLFELANHIVRVRDGNRRRQLAERYREDVAMSLTDDRPWTVASDPETGVLLTATTLLDLADRFVAQSGPAYSLADISILELAKGLRRQGIDVRVLTFDEEMESYSD